MELADALKLLAKTSPIRPLLPKLVHADAGVRETAYDKLSDLDSSDKPRKITKRDAIAELTIATSLVFPPQPYDWSGTTLPQLWTIALPPEPSSQTSLSSPFRKTVILPRPGS